MFHPSPPRPSLWPNVFEKAHSESTEFTTIIFATTRKPKTERSFPRDSSIIWSVTSVDYSWQRIIVDNHMTIERHQHHQLLLQIMFSFETTMCWTTNANAARCRTIMDAAVKRLWDKTPNLMTAIWFIRSSRNWESWAIPTSVLLLLTTIQTTQ